MPLLCEVFCVKARPGVDKPLDSVASGAVSIVTPMRATKFDAFPQPSAGPIGPVVLLSNLVRTTINHALAVTLVAGYEGRESAEPAAVVAASH